MKKDPASIIDIIPPALRKRAEEAERRLQSKKQSTEVQQEARQEYLPFWPDEMRCLPNEVLRSALFTARNRKQPRENLKNATIYMIGSGKITYTGEELRQDDETVWLQLVHLAKEQEAGTFFEFTPYAFCKAVHWPLKGQSYTRLLATLTRMQATSLKVYSNRLKKGVSLSMIPGFEYQDDETGGKLPRWRVQIAPGLVELFGDVHFSRMEWEQRLELPVGLATWLHGYLASHKEPYPIKIETIKKGAGLTTEDKSHLIGIVEAALQALEDVKFLSDWSIDDDLVSVTRA
jgi:hypothetical protein